MGILIRVLLVIIECIVVYCGGVFKSCECFGGRVCRKGVGGDILYSRLYRGGSF